MSAKPLRAPFPWFGGKRRAAERIWAALGNPDHYVEPFAGSAAVLLARPDPARCETINDADGMVSNFWRAIRSAPEAVAEWADWPVNEVDLHARHLWLIGQRESLTEHLIADPEWCDPKAAGWWVWGACAWIGTGWCSQPSRKMPHTGDEGRGMDAPSRSRSLSRQVPHLSGEGQGIHAPSRQLPHVGDEGRVLHAPRRGAAFADDAVAHTSVREWFAALSERLRPVRVCSGDWSRVLGSSALWAHVRTSSTGVVGVYLDPPYSEGSQDYAVGGTGTSLSAEVRAWCEEHGSNPRLRIVLSGYAGEHDALEALGWRVEEWKTKGGYSSAGGKNENQKRERLWLSPACAGSRRPVQVDLFAGARTP
jgi:hypothetical protein